MNKRTKLAVINRDGHECQYCGAVVVDGTHGPDSLVIDHVSGRDEDMSNYCVACRHCNSTKGHLTAEEWATKIVKTALKANRDIEKVIRINALLRKLSLCHFK